MKKLLSVTPTLLIVGAILFSTGCSQSPVRNPFAGRSEPKLGQLQELPKTQHKTVKVAWTNGSLAKHDPFSKLVPYLAGNTIYAADKKGKVMAINQQTGRKTWEISTKKKFAAGPALIEGKLLLTTSDAKVVALDAATGKVNWETKVPSEVLATPAGGHGVVLVHAIDGSLTALNAKNGETLWHVDESTPSLTLHFNSPPMVSANKAIVGYANGKLSAYNLQTGVIEWERVVSVSRGRSELQRMVDISADPIVADNTIYAITYQGKLAAIDTSTGNLQWERDISSYRNMAIDKQKIYVTDNAFHLWALDRATGATLWKQASLADRYITGPAVLGGNVIVGDRAGYMHFLSAENGHLLDRYRFSGKLYQNPKTIGNRLLVNAENGKLAALAVMKEQG